MIQKCSNLKVLEVFFQEPTTIQFIREIGRKIKLAPTSVKKNMDALLEMNLIKEEKSKPFNGFIANRDNGRFLHLKRTYNLYTLYDLKEKINATLHPRLIVVFGSYCLGEDVEESDLDVLIISKVKKEIDLKKIEKNIKREINLIFVKSLNELDENIQKKVMNGFVLQGGF